MLETNCCFLISNKNRGLTQLNRGGGLFSQRSVYEWVFFFEDPLLLKLQPGDPQTAIRHNDTSIEDADLYKGTVKIWTGQGAFPDIANVTLWNGTDALYIWEQPITIWGNNQDVRNGNRKSKQKAMRIRFNRFVSLKRECFLFSLEKHCFFLFDLFFFSHRVTHKHRQGSICRCPAEQHGQLPRSAPVVLCLVG